MLSSRRKTAFASSGGVRQALQAEYLPATLTSRGLSGPIAAGAKVETVAVGAVLIAFKLAEGTDR